MYFNLYTLLIIFLLSGIGFSNQIFQNNFIQPDTTQPVLKINLIGDTQHKSFWELFLFSEDNSDKIPVLFNEIAARKPDFVIHLGDITSFGSSQRHWKMFDEDSKILKSKNISVYPVFGNHEYFGDNESCYKNFYKHFPSLSGQKWYSFIKQNTGFVMINSNFGELTQDESNAQKIWYNSTLDNMEKDTAIKFIIVCDHHPPFTNSTVVSADEEVEKYYAEPFYKYTKTAIFFSGHCHSYEKFIVDDKYFIVSGGGGGSRQKLDINKKTRKFDDKFAGGEIRFLNFCQLEIYENKINLSVIKLNSDNTFSIADEFTIIK